LDLVLSELDSIINVVRDLPSWIVENLLRWFHSLYRCGLLDWSSRSFLLLSNLCWLFFLGGSDGDCSGEKTLVLTFSISICSTPALNIWGIFFNEIIEVLLNASEGPIPLLLSIIGLQFSSNKVDGAIEVGELGIVGLFVSGWDLEPGVHVDGVLHTSEMVHEFSVFLL